MDVEEHIQKELKKFEENRWSPNELYWSADGKYLLTRSSARVLVELVYP